MASLLTAASATSGAADGAGGKQQTQSPQSLSSCSPRNAASPGANIGQTAASNTTVAMNNPTAVKLGVMDVPKALQDGEKFIKWDELTAANNVVNTGPVAEHHKIKAI
uniref:Uncharacterized protein n=1 Tax=Anopheles culicifacies TaxID=139723 RepID=A0A182MGM9_9DIPT